jgi:general secretion pathway protein D
MAKRSSLGGLMSDQSIMINDKIPIVGDLPFLGKFFQSKVKQKRAKNLLFFVTVKGGRSIGESRQSRHVIKS